MSSVTGERGAPEGADVSQTDLDEAVPRGRFARAAQPAIATAGPSRGDGVALPAGRRAGAASARSRLVAALRAAVLLLLPVIALLALRAFVAEPFRIPSASMAPTLQPGDHVLADKLAYRFASPRVGDIVVVERPGGNDVLVKRVVALAGQRVEIRDGVLHVDGRPRRERHVDYDMVDGFFFGPARVAPGAVFVMGDRRGNSEDSRDLGSIPLDDVVARVDVRIWPPGRAGTPD